MVLCGDRDALGTMVLCGDCDTLGTMVLCGDRDALGTMVWGTLKLCVDDDVTWGTLTLWGTKVLY